MFSKPLRELTAQDVHQLCKEEVQEEAAVEFKRTLAAKDGKDDPWISRGETIGDHAKSDVIKEVVAFANAYGGTLILGVEETAEKPARAGKINPLPRCHDLAERFRMICRDGIDPKIPLLDVMGISTEDDGSGVVVFGVPRSRAAPHRSKSDLHCYFRHADRSEKMTMREIQELTLQVRQHLDSVEETFSQAGNEFTHLMGKLENRKQMPVVGMRTTLAPLDPIVIDNVHRHVGAKPMIAELTATFSNGRQAQLHTPLDCGSGWRPTQRGSAVRAEKDDGFSARTISNVGVINFFWGEITRGEPENGPLLFSSWVLGLFGNGLLAIERFRAKASAPDVEYGLEFEIVVTRQSARVGGYGSLFRPVGEIDIGRHVFPRYSIGPREYFNDLTALFDQDFWNLSGKDSEDSPIIDFDGVLRER